MTSTKKRMTGGTQDGKNGMNGQEWKMKNTKRGKRRKKERKGKERLWVREEKGCLPFLPSSIFWNRSSTLSLSPTFIYIMSLLDFLHYLRPPFFLSHFPLSLFLSLSLSVVLVKIILWKERSSFQHLSSSFEPLFSSFFFYFSSCHKLNGDAISFFFLAHISFFLLFHIPFSFPPITPFLLFLFLMMMMLLKTASWSCSQQIMITYFKSKDLLLYRIEKKNEFYVQEKNFRKKIAHRKIDEEPNMCFSSQ